MARYCGSDNPQKIFFATEQWISRCLLGRKSVFTDKNIWSLRNLEELIEHYVENLDTGKGKFFQKLNMQLSDTTNEAKMLAAEMLWVMFLCPTNITARAKKYSIKRVWEFSNIPYDENHYLLDDTYMTGVGDCGIGYNNHRWRELKYFVCIIHDLLKLKPAERKRLIQNSERFAAWLETYTNEHGNRQLRHMLLFMTFPDDNDRIFSTSHRKAVVKQLGLTNLVMSRASARDIDQELLIIRSHHEATYISKGIYFEGLDFYTPPLSNEWNTKAKAKTKYRKKPINQESNSLSQDLNDIANNSNLTGSERETSIKTRVGQGAFRASLIMFWGGKCSVTKYLDDSVLIASHIKPWRDSSPHEKVSVYNGFLLTPNLDKAFDRGLISFSDSGNIIISEKLRSPAKFGIYPKMTVGIKDKHLPFLAYHRKKHGFV